MKVKVSLTPDKSMGCGYLLHCCGKRQPVNVDEMDTGDRWHCVDCDKPLLLRYGDRFFEIGEDITI